MAFDPGFPNADEDAHLVENKARIKPDYSILSADSFPTLTASDAGRIIEYTDTGDRFRWTGALIVPTHIAGNLIISDGGGSLSVDNGGVPLGVDDAGGSLTVDDGGISLTVDSDDGSLSIYHKPDYSQLSTAGDPTPAATDYGVTLEYTDTGDRFRWTGLSWVQTHSSGSEIATDFYFEVSKGTVKGHSPVNVVGHDSDVGTSLSTIGNNIGLLQTYSASADIDSISSDNAGDTHDITIQGLDINYEPVAPFTVTLNGQNRVALPTSLFRINAIYNATGTATLGLIWVYVNTAITAGKPIDLTKIRSSIHQTSGIVSNERDTNTVFTIPAGKSAYIVFGKMTVSDSKAIELTFWGRQNGGVFQLFHHIDVKNNNYDYFFKLPLSSAEKADVEVRGAIDAGTADVAAVYDIVLVDL